MARKRTRLATLVSLATPAIFLPELALAEPVAGPAAAPMAAVSQDAPSGYAFGFRVGGWGFRNPNATEATGKWSDCRMNGVGVFGEKHLGKYAFAEVGTDVYFSDDFPVGGHSHDDPNGQSMDRLSGLVTVAAGLKMAPIWRISLHTVAGIGVELTKVKLGDHHMQATLQESRIFPMGFIGVGADVRVTKKLKVGATFRTLIMGHYLHHQEITELDAEPEAANQGQFFIKYDL